MAPGFISPGHLQDYHRFLAHAKAAFQHDQVEILRAANPDWFIFDKLGNLADIDFRGQFGLDLDLIGFDIYPSSTASSAAQAALAQRKPCTSTSAAPNPATSSYRNRHLASAGSPDFPP